MTSHQDPNEFPSFSGHLDTGREPTVPRFRTVLDSAERLLSSLRKDKPRTDKPNKHHR